MISRLLQIQFLHTSWRHSYSCHCKLWKHIICPYISIYSRCWLLSCGFMKLFLRPCIFFFFGILAASPLSSFQSAAATLSRHVCPAGPTNKQTVEKSQTSLCFLRPLTLSKFMPPTYKKLRMHPSYSLCWPLPQAVSRLVIQDTFITAAVQICMCATCTQLAPNMESKWGVK